MLTDQRVSGDGVRQSGSPVRPWSRRGRFSSLGREETPTSKMSFRRALHARRRCIFVAAIFLAVGIAYMLAWTPVVEHRSGWVVGGDLWGIFRGAHYIGWGYLGGVYFPSNGIVSLPGLEIVLAPVAMLSGKLGLSESYMPFFLAHPTAALLLQPIILIFGSTVLFAADALAERLDVTRKRRVILCVVVATIAWPVVAVWGHAEDCLSVAFAIYALIAACDGHWPKCGWLLGIAIVMQPLAALLVPLAIGATPAGQRAMVLIRSAAISAFLVAVTFASNAGWAYQALVKEPTPPALNHATPWVALAPTVTGAGSFRTTAGAVSSTLGHWAVTSSNAVARDVVTVSGGPGRLLYVVVALLVGVFAWRRPPRPEQLIWLAALVLGMRCLFEAVMTPYYLAPPLVLALVMAARGSRTRFWAAAVIAVEVTVFSYHHLEPWLWWLPVVIGSAAVLALACPTSADGVGIAWRQADGHKVDFSVAADPRDLAMPEPEPDRVPEPVS